MGGSFDFGGGYPVILFVQNDFSKFLCCICSKILREPIQSFCGHRFCKGCITEVLGSGLMIRCPQCKLEGIEEEEYSVLKADQMYPDNAVKREMSRIKVRCVNVNAGCSWQGYFRDYEDHASQCQYRMAQCLQCGNSLPQLELSEHMTKTCPKKPVNCKHCGEMITSAEVLPRLEVSKNSQRKISSFGSMSKCFCIKDHQDNECPSRKWSWPPDGKMLKDHQDNECPNRKWTCPVDGQMVEGNRFPKHVEKSTGNHLVFVMRQGDNINQRVTQLEERINNMSCPESGEMQMRVRQLEVKTDTFEGIVTALHRDIEQCITTQETIDRQRKGNREMIESNERKNRSLERTLALKDIKINDLEARIESLEYASYDGILIWKIPEFSKRRLEAQQGKPFSIYSPAFYTSRTGYKMCVQMYPNGDGMGKGSHMSLFFVIMRGPYDALLNWPFMQHVTFELIDQKNEEHVFNSFRLDPASSSFKRPTSDMNIGRGCPLFIPHRRLDDSSYGYLKEDTMYIKTVVDTANLPILNDNKIPADLSNVKEHSA